MYGIFGEDQSDFETLKEIVRKLKGDPGLTIKGKGFGGCGNLLNAGSRSLELLHESGFRRFIVVHDSDDQTPEQVKQDVMDRVIKPAGLDPDAAHCIVVPVRAIEAWIFADIESANKMFPSWRPAEVKNPEALHDPKHELEKRSRDAKNKPRYDHKVNNP